MRPRPLRGLLPLALTILVSTALVACSAGSASVAPATTAPSASAAGGMVTVYSGRSEELVGPLLERFENETGIDVEVKYAGSSELAATILEEGDNSPADVYLAQDAGALGAVAAESRLATLPDDVLNRVDARFRSTEGTWVGVSGRARVAAYDTRKLAPADLPASILDFATPAWKGRLGWAPTNGSFQAFVTALRLLEGEDAARAWLEGVLANDPKTYEGNDAIIQALADEEIEVGFVNHYYLLRQLQEQGAGFPVANHSFAAGDAGALVNVAGVGILGTSKNPDAATALVRYLLTDAAQAYFSEETLEYPLVAGVPAAPELRPLSAIGSPELDLSDLADLEATLTLLRETGVL